ncbi:MAG: pyruvate kinase [Candidatus Baumannia cicadellinicola]|nr:pyruvate kinase [Candidatus Baumannia cicadellinicola]MCJ7462258.1 pyruvate kinase [Candidatus Baumannia cicadellinicola]MCJ7462524.1 pyruvate kinase [Candidatus Baumannia cicadellinicola]
MLRRLRRTKIVTTLGPATDRDDNLKKVILAGANVVRLNFSHSTAEDHIRRAQEVRKIAASLGCHIAILGDLQGPKIRISTFCDEGILLSAGDHFILDATIACGVGDRKRVGIDYKDLPNDVFPGDILLLDDGKIQLKVLKVETFSVHTQVTIGGWLSNHKGINKLGGGLSAHALTKKDQADIITAAKIGVDYLAISFPRDGKDILYARQLAQNAGCHAKIVSKIERAEVVYSDQAIEDMILASDVIMVARGDLGVEIGDAELVGIQKKLIQRARQLNRAVITATQMMESMINNLIPTRAEVMDVANAVIDGTDAVMLSAETASGHYPAETVAAMAKVCLGAEKIPSVNISKHRIDVQFDNIEETIAMSAMYAANHLKGITAIISMTKSGRTALMMSRISSGLPIFALSRHEHTLNLTALYRGVTPIYFNDQTQKEGGVATAIHMTRLLRNQGFLKVGDLVIITQGDIIDTVGTTNTSRILLVE